MADPYDVIPEDRLPPGFAARIDNPPAEPVTPAPSATVVLARPGADGFEVLLLRRLRSSGFVPGAYVFPGGRVDAADASVDLIARTVGMTAEPEPAYWMAAAREAFEETGLLLGVREDGGSCARGDGALDAWRHRLLADETTLIDVLVAEDVRLDFRCTAYCAHWITPVAEPRRYDTRFFLAEVPDDCRAEIDAREMSASVWLRPIDAIGRFEAGELPMVFPTVRTLHELARFATIDDALAHYRSATIRPIQPKLVRRDGGIGFQLDDPQEDDA